ncbi:MFS transporter [Luteibacter sp. ME-Dv--P-043b]|uniref:MFS transporter n=1 Tax=Luteibacter sp. ME-Dv--P-043b TaxID=3040291 RepID=UPI0025537377|nr:MFS transporter [Luteibacter sp. ME-Dv--P-043b]
MIGAMGRLRRLWRVGRREPRFKLLLLDNLTTTLGASFTLVALPFLVMRLTGKAWDLGITMAIEATPSLCLLLAFPRLLDRVDPLRTLRLCRWFFVIANAAIALLVWRGGMSIVAVYVSTALGGIVWAVAFPAGRAVFTLYVRKGWLSIGNAIFALVSAVATVVLPLVAGWLIFGTRGDTGLAVAFGIDAICVLCSLPLLAALRRHGPIRRSPGSPSSPRVTTSATAKAIAIPRVFHAYVFASSVLVFGPVQILLPLILARHRGGSYLLIYVVQCMGVGVASTVAQRVAPSFPGTARRMLACWAVASTAYLLLCQASGPAVTLLAFLLFSFAAARHGIQSQSWLQRHVPSHDVGHEMTRFSAATLCGTPIAALLTGGAMDALGFEAATLVLSLAITLGVLLGAVHVHRLGETLCCR